MTPTGQALKDRTNYPDQMFAVPSRPGTPQPMSPNTNTVVNNFHNDIQLADPSGRMQKQGEFFKTYSLDPNGKPVPNIPLHYEKGGGINNPPPGSFNPPPSHTIHSHPKDSLSNRPSSNDYYESYKAGRPEMMSDIGRGKVYGYQGTEPPKFNQLYPPGQTPSTPGSSSSSSSGGSTPSNMSDFGSP